MEKSYLEEFQLPCEPGHLTRYVLGECSGAGETIGRVK